MVIKFPPPSRGELVNGISASVSTNYGVYPAFGRAFLTHPPKVRRTPLESPFPKGMASPRDKFSTSVLARGAVDAAFWFLHIQISHILRILFAILLLRLQSHHILSPNLSRQPRRNLSAISSNTICRDLSCCSRCSSRLRYRGVFRRRAYE